MIIWEYSYGYSAVDIHFNQFIHVYPLWVMVANMQPMPIGEIEGSKEQGLRLE